MICLIASILIGAGVVWTGPAFDDLREKLRRKREFPAAKLLK